MRSRCPTCKGNKEVRDRRTGAIYPCPTCVTGEWAKRKKLGWSAGYWEPGGYVYNVDGKWRVSSTYVIVFNIILAIGQLGFWFLAMTLARAKLETFIYQTIFFTFTTNLVTWFFALNTWKYAKDSSDALVSYSEDVDKKMREFGMTIADLSEIGGAIRESGMTAEGVKDAIKETRVLVGAIKEMGIKLDEVKEFVGNMRKLNVSQKTEKLLTEGTFEAAFTPESAVNG